MSRSGRSRWGHSGTARPQRLPPPLSVSPLPCAEAPGQAEPSLCPGVPVSSSPSLISRGKPRANAPFQQTASPGSHGRDFDLQKVQGFSLPQSSPQCRLCLPKSLPGSQCPGFFLVLTTWSSLTGAAPGGLQPPPALCCLCWLAGSHETDHSTPPPLSVGAYFQFFPNYFIPAQSTLSASVSNQAASEPQLWLQFFFLFFGVEPEQTKSS